MKRQTPKDLRRPPAGGEVVGLTKALTKVNQDVSERKAQRGRPKAATRADKKGLVIYLDPIVNKALRLLALELDQSVHRLGLEAVRLLLDRHNIAMPSELLPARLLPVLVQPARLDGSAIASGRATAGRFAASR